jgi:hypothetical protein
MRKASKPLTAQLVRRTLSANDPWSIGNQVLYDLCRLHPRHTVDAEIVAKIWLIGRAYAASIERGRGKAADSGVSNDRFYTEAVPKALRTSGLDDKLEALAMRKTTTESNVGPMLDAHAHLVHLFHGLTNKSKRSLASKYLHFHRPDLFFIYDSRAVQGVRVLGIPARTLEVPPDADREYARFVGAAIGVREYVRSELGRRLSPRELDRLLLAIAASGDRVKPAGAGEDWREQTLHGTRMLRTIGTR